MTLIAPEVIGTPIEELLRHGAQELESFEPSRPFSADDLNRVRFHRIVPLVDSAWVAPQLRSSFRLEQRTAAVTQLRLEAELGRVVGLFDSAGIESRVLKGLATGNLDYPERGMRQAGDIDLLVLPSSLESVDRILTEKGFERHHFAQHFDPLLNKGMTYVGSGGIEVDVHTRLTCYSSQDVHDLMADSEPLVELPGRALGRDLRVLHAAGHLMWSPYGSRRLNGLVDVLAARQRGTGSGLAEAARRHGLLLAAPAIQAVDLLAGMPVETDPWPRLSLLERRAWLAGQRHPIAERALAVRATTGVRNRIRHAWDVVPKGSYVKNRGGWRAYAHRVARIALSGADPPD